MDCYLEWIQQEGGSYTKLDFRADPINGTVHSSQAVHSGDTIATVPFKVAITERVARQAFPTLSAFSCRSVMALFIAHETLMGNKSYYAPYLNILPKHIGVPFFWETDDLHYLDKTNLATAVYERKQDIHKEYTCMMKEPPMDSVQAVTWEGFLWAYAVLTSRAFPYTLIDPTHTDPSEVLFPLVDALNHKPNTKITWERHGVDPTGMLSFVSGQHYEAGEEVFNNYGPKSNEELLLGYGFCFPVNEHDHVALKPNFSRDPNCELKLSILQKCTIISGNIEPLTHYVHRNHVPEAFLKLMRVLVMNAVEAEAYSQCEENNALAFVGYRNELAMIAMTCTLLQSKLNALQSVFLDREPEDMRRQYALMYRQGQEDVLHSVLSVMENNKQVILRKMVYDKRQGRLAPVAPLLSIVNLGYYQSLEYPNMESENFIMMSSVVITPSQVLGKDRPFKAAIDELFEDIQEEEDIVMMLALLRERSKATSQWQPFFEKTKAPLQEPEDLEDMYSSLFPAFSDAYPDIFPHKHYTFELFQWADAIMSQYALENPLCIVPL
ncbi:hypothetical protein BDF14DRAFT_1816675, partial [Spinellus fusiger]